MEEKNRKDKQEREKSGFREFFELIAETAVFVFFVMTFVVQAFQIPTGSMEPTLLIGDFLLVNKLIYNQPQSGLDRLTLPIKKIKRYDIVVFKYPQDPARDFVKRVIALQGEKIEIKNKQVYINDAPVPEKYKVHIEEQSGEKDGYYYYNDTIMDNYGPVVVPAGHCFAMGDNRDNSLDSRYWGFLPLDLVKGRPWIIYFSYRAEKNAYQKTSFADRLRKFVSFIPKARWTRLLKIIK
jgi:signal peptidase I